MPEETVQFFYNFCFPDDTEGFKNYGFYYLSHQRERIYSHTEFNTPDGIYRNIFNLKIKENSVLAYKHNDAAWVDVQENHFPTSAYPLLLPKVDDEPLSYLSVTEDTGKLIGEVVLLCDGDDIIETVQGKVMRRFMMKSDLDLYLDLPNYVPRSIDWGGAKSFLCRDKFEAVKGTSFEIDETIHQI